MLARLVPSLTGRPFTSLAASRSPTASGRATMCSTTRTRAKNTTPSFGRWLTNGFASSLSAGKSAPPITRTNTWKPLRNEAPFSLPYTCKQIHEKYGREGSGDYPEATPRLPWAANGGNGLPSLGTRGASRSRQYGFPSWGLTTTCWSLFGDWGTTVRLRGGPREGLVQGWRNRASAVWGAKLGSDGSPRRGRQAKDQNRDTAWRVILQASPVTIPSKRAKNLHAGGGPGPSPSDT